MPKPKWRTAVPKREGFYWCRIYHQRWRQWLVAPCFVAWLKDTFHVEVFRCGVYCKWEKKVIFFGPKMRVPVYD